ncbi:hypothetical protein RF679_02320 [Undibacterium cyanobacteriorum]|uniref:DUF7661 domain-containing protein n=1 Tax=Undibacterium cyanobacteriorum TaxID=3073561 RepID=A0ABY9RLI8_9BURK|nr:hypothetical protein [Undibacterium sp. 20NA77.5]WMW81130.1 hypothetical protein RF679_02320 [Undibacterium sp. 20NA77.5]
MRFNIYGRFQIVVEKIDGAWIAYQVSQGIRTPVEDLVIPHDVAEHEMLTYLDDIYHEYAGFGQVIERVS